jgi:transcriptional regulator with XRE-family HTH domain
MATPARPAALDDDYAALDIGQRLKSLRRAQGHSLSDLARRTGISEATLSRVENNQTPVSAHSLYVLSKALGVDITAFFDAEPQPISAGVRSVCRRGEGVPFFSARYDAQVLCTDLANKKMHPAINTVTIRSVDEAGGFSRHDGEEFVHVLDGALLLATEFYEPLKLEAGDSVYFDSRMGHAYLAAGDAPTRILVVATTEPPAKTGGGDG